jgi:hypothetical protein
MALLRVISEPGDPLGVIQCVDLFDPAAKSRLPFSRYYVRLLMLVRDLVRGRFARNLDRTDALLGAEISEVFADFRPTISVRAICVGISSSRVVQKSLQCPSISGCREQ